MADHNALVIGPTGAIGSALVQALDGAGGWGILGMSRTAPSQGARFRHLAADLMDADTIRSALADAPPVTHVFYAARAPHGEGGVENVDGNLAMLANVVEAVQGPTLQHVHLVEGTKWYGVHLGPHRTPAREDDPRHMPPNFYYDQEDYLISAQRGHAWTWSSCRPNVVCDFAQERARNLTTVIGAWGAICRELGVPFDFPGTAVGFDSLTEVTDAAHLANAIIWLSTQPGGANRAFNITNGDAFRWRYMWPKLAKMLDLPCGEPRDIRLADWMADKGPVWDRITARHGLDPRPLERVALWAFGDFVFRQDWDLLSDLTRLRQTGFAGSVDTSQMFADHFAAYRKVRILPTPGVTA